jgi:hypothetical protein
MGVCANVSSFYILRRGDQVCDVMVHLVQWRAGKHGRQTHHVNRARSEPEIPRSNEMRLSIYAGESQGFFVMLVNIPDCSGQKINPLFYSLSIELCENFSTF